MSISEVVGALDRYRPEYVRIDWTLYEATVSIGRDTIQIARNDIRDVENMLNTRGFKRTSEDVDPRGGIEGTYLYSRK